jgi:branched-chain amino acid transport system ATP-binding protein
MLRSAWAREKSAIDFPISVLGISLLISESNLVNAARIADRLYAIDRGEIIFEGKPQQALEDENVMRALRG